MQLSHIINIIIENTTVLLMYNTIATIHLKMQCDQLLSERDEIRGMQSVCGVCGQSLIIIIITIKVYKRNL